MNQTSPKQIKELHPAEKELQGISEEIKNPLPLIKQTLVASVLSSSAFLGMDIPERPTLLDPFFKQGDYGIIFAPRGVGKSWLSLLMGKALSESSMMGTHWKGKEAQRILYLDSEMNLYDLQERCRMLAITSDNFSILSHEVLFSASGDSLSLNLTEPAQQQAILNYCEEMETNVLILDNLSTAFRGLKENESDSWEQVSPWILDLRRRGIAVILVCHAGRNGQIRGTSKREDPAHWILSLEDMDGLDEDGCHQFKTKFTKCRNCAPSYAPSLAWKLIHTEQGIIAETRAIDLYDQFLELVAGGGTSASEIASELGKGKGTISKWAHKAQADAKIMIKNGRYLPSN
ncbi:MAG: AAA family ATPase [Akkermansiaceae bacterium]|nr:AAA family ATPase [Akkermansiaceae bacterium]